PAVNGASSAVASHRPAEASERERGVRSSVRQPAGARDHVLLHLARLAREAPCQGVHDSPATEAFSVDAKFGRKLVETAMDTRAGSRILDQLLPPVAKQGSGVEGAFADERLRVDRQPRLAFGAQDVSTVK